MAIPPELAGFPNEEAFRDRFLVPLFQRFGFSVHNYHGTREYGKDLLLGKIDEFGHRLYYGVQAKFEDSIGQGGAGDLLRDVREAFDNPFKHPLDGTEQRISRFYVVNGGSVSDQLRDNFFNGIHEPARKANTQLFDGKTLLYLDRFASFNRTGLVREQLTAIQIEKRINCQTLDLLAAKVDNFVTSQGPYPLARVRTEACSAWLEKPPIMDGQFYGAVHDFVGSLRMINYIVDSMDRTISVVNYKADRYESFKTVSTTARIEAQHVDRMAADLLSQQSPLV